MLKLLRNKDVRNLILAATVLTLVLAVLAYVLGSQASALAGAQVGASVGTSDGASVGVQAGTSEGASVVASNEPQAGAIAGALAAGMVVVLGVTLITLFWVFAYRRHQRLADMATQIDLIMHGDNSLDFRDYTEGELSILQTEVQKMTVMLREQAANLKQEKLYLQDSIADISHQIRTPLTAIGIVSELLSRPELDSASRLKQTQQLENLLSRIDWLTTTLLRMSKIDTGTAVLDCQHLFRQNY